MKRYNVVGKQGMKFMGRFIGNLEEKANIELEFHYRCSLICK